MKREPLPKVTLEQFRASVTILTPQEAEDFTTQPWECKNVRNYMGSFIADNGDGTYSLVICNQDWWSSDLAELERILFTQWADGEILEAVQS